MALGCLDLDFAIMDILICHICNHSGFFNFLICNVFKVFYMALGCHVIILVFLLWNFDILLNLIVWRLEPFGLVILF